MSESVTTRQLNRWTLARQHLLERTALDATAAVSALAGMQAQHPASPYIGLWSRLEGFERADLADALADDRVVKTTVMRGTLHLVATSELAHYRRAAGSSYYEGTRRRLLELGVDLDAIRAHVLSEVGHRPHTRAEVSRLVAAQLGEAGATLAAERPTAVAAVSVSTDLVNAAEDAAFDHRGGSHYRVAPVTEPVTAAEAHRHVAATYLRAFGPATRADLAQWSGNTVRAFTPALADLDLVTFQADDGRTLLDLADAPRGEADGRAPVRFLPRWDSLLLGHADRERVIATDLRKVVIANNGDVSPTFLVDGFVAGTWEVTWRGKAILTLHALRSLPARDRRAVEAEGERLVAWVRPDGSTHDVAWS